MADSPLNNFLTKNPADAVDSIMGSRNSEAAMRETMTALRGNAASLAAFKRSIADWFKRQIETAGIQPVSGDPVQSFAKVNGSQRQVGTIFPNDPLRQVFLGTIALGDEQSAMQYGRDRERDVAGYVERVGPNRWRLIMPRPAFESVIDVMELVPAG